MLTPEQKSDIKEHHKMLLENAYSGQYFSDDSFEVIDVDNNCELACKDCEEAADCDSVSREEAINYVSELECVVMDKEEYEAYMAWKNSQQGK